MNPTRYIPYFFLLIGSAFLVSCGGSKKEDGKDQEKQEKKDTTASNKDTSEDGITAAKFANAVRKRILEKARKNDSVLVMADPRSGKDSLRVKLHKVVEQSVSKFSENVRYVCAKFRGADDGKHYDIDFYLKGNEPSSLKPQREPLVHKVDGKTRYKYVEKEGFKRPERVQEPKAPKDQKAKMDQKPKKDKKMKGSGKKDAKKAEEESGIQKGS